ncbi:MAG: glycosyltransferase family 2 protein [Actinomycetes bacterium]
MSVDDRRIAVLVPAHEEESQVAGVLAGIPAWVDHVVVIDDGSADRTSAVVTACATADPRIELITLPENRGVGGALAVGYAWAVEHDVDVAVTMDGDGQMHPGEMIDLVLPIVRGQADYTKGNRLADPGYWSRIPRLRLLGNAVLSLLTKIASGYWAVTDSQSGYSAAGRRALRRIDWSSMYSRYGRPNDVLVLANVAGCRVADVPITALYGVGERSTMRIGRITLPMAWLLFRRFWYRMFYRYTLRDFHPLVFFYCLFCITGVIGAVLVVRLVAMWVVHGYVPQTTALALMFATLTGLNSLFFAFWMDMQANEPLNIRLGSDAEDERGSYEPSAPASPAQVNVTQAQPPPMRVPMSDPAESTPAPPPVPDGEQRVEAQ